MADRLTIEGLPELRRLLRAAGGAPMQKELGKVHKDIGAMVISRLSPRPDPAAVGQGGGAAVRASAAVREVLLRVGGKHREQASLPKPTTSKSRYALAYWGKRPGPLAFRRRPKRPDILGTALDNQDDISSRYLTGVERILWSMDVS